MPWDPCDVVSPLLPYAFFLHFAVPVETTGDRAKKAAWRLANRLRGFLFRARKACLFILDDVWYPDNLIPLLMTEGRAATLFTTRQRPVAEFVPAGHREEPPRLGFDDALALFIEHAGKAMYLKHRQGYEELVQKLGGLPLGLVVAGKLLANTAAHRRSVARILAALRKKTAMLLSQRVPPNVQQFMEDVDNPTVVAVFQTSTDELEPVAKNCFRALGDSTPVSRKSEVTFPLRRMARGWQLPLDAAQRVADQLLDAGLIQLAQPIGDVTRYSMHDLLIQHAKTMYGPDEE